MEKETLGSCSSAHLSSSSAVFPTEWRTALKLWFNEGIWRLWNRASSELQLVSFLQMCRRQFAERFLQSTCYVMRRQCCRLREKRMCFGLTESYFSEDVRLISHFLARIAITTHMTGWIWGLVVEEGLLGAMPSSWYQTDCGVARSKASTWNENCLRYQGLSNVKIKWTHVKPTFRGLFNNG